MLIGQAPSRSASDCGRPFSRDINVPDGSGARLIDWLGLDAKVFYNPKKFYITGVAHCYPGKGRSGDKRPPKYCADKWLKRELSYLRPRLIVVIGKYASDYVTKHFLLPEKRFDELVFKDWMLNGISTVFMPHPSRANIKWLKDHEDFEESRLEEIKRSVKAVIGGEWNIPRGKMR